MNEIPLKPLKWMGFGHVRGYKILIIFFFPGNSHGFGHFSGLKGILFIYKFWGYLVVLGIFLVILVFWGVFW